MSRLPVLILLFSTTLYLGSCRPIEYQVLNRIGADTQLEIYGRNHNLLSYGRLENGVELSLPEGEQSIYAIDYMGMNGKVCRIGRDQILDNKIENYGTPAFVLHDC